MMNGLVPVKIAGTGRATTGLQKIDNDTLAKMLLENRKDCEAFFFSSDKQRWRTWWESPQNAHLREKVMKQYDDPKEVEFRRTQDSQVTPKPGSFQACLWPFVAKEFETDDEWITRRTGIKTRYFADDNTATSDMAAEAILAALADANLTTNDVDAIVVATVSPDYHTTPPTVSPIVKKCGISYRWPDGRIRPLVYADISDACNSWMVAFHVACNLIETGECEVVVVVGADKGSITNSRYSRNIYPILSDGGAAVVLEAGSVTIKRPRFFSTVDGSLAELIINEYGGSAKPLTTEIIANPFDQRHLMAMAGQEVMSWVLDALLPNPLLSHQPMNKFVPAALAKFGFQMECYDDLARALNHYDFIVTHQANGRIKDKLNDQLCKLGYRHKTYDIIEEFANPISAAIPMVLHEARRERKLRPGHRVLAIGFGGGGMLTAADFIA